jgi:MmoB/DmpM family
MVSAETEAALEYLRARYPDVSVSSRGCFYKVERPGSLDFDLAEISSLLGRDLDTDLFLVNMSSYYGRIVVSDGKVQIFADIQPERFRE